MEQTDGSAATLVQRGADAVGIEEGAAAEKEDEGKEKVDERSANQKKIFKRVCFVVRYGITSFIKQTAEYWKVEFLEYFCKCLE